MLSGGLFFAESRTIKYLLDYMYLDYPNLDYPNLNFPDFDLLDVKRTTIVIFPDWREILFYFFFLLFNTFFFTSWSYTFKLKYPQIRKIKQNKESSCYLLKLSAKNIIGQVNVHSPIPNFKHRSNDHVWHMFKLVQPEVPLFSEYYFNPVIGVTGKKTRGNRKK